MKLYWTGLTKCAVHRWWMVFGYHLSSRRGPWTPPPFQKEDYCKEPDCSEITVGKTTYQVHSFCRNGDGRELSDKLLKLIAGEEA